MGCEIDDSTWGDTYGLYLLLDSVLVKEHFESKAILVDVLGKM